MLFIFDFSFKKENTHYKHNFVILPLSLWSITGQIFEKYTSVDYRINVDV